MPRTGGWLPLTRGPPPYTVADIEDMARDIVYRSTSAWFRPPASAKLNTTHCKLELVVTRVPPLPRDILENEAVVRCIGELWNVPV